MSDRRRGVRYAAPLYWGCWGGGDRRRLQRCGPGHARNAYPAAPRTIVCYQAGAFERCIAAVSLDGQSGSLAQDLFEFSSLSADWVDI